MKLFLDTNILIDYLARREPYFSDAKKLRIAALFGDVELWASLQSYTDAEYILRRAIPVDTLRAMMEKTLPFVQVASPEPEDLEAGTRCGWPDLEDFLIARCAVRTGADYLVTRDVKGFARSEVAAVAPTEFFALLEEEWGILYDEIDG